MDNIRKSLYEDFWKRCDHLHEARLAAYRYERYFALVKRQKPGKILDLGCGPGFFAAYLKKELPAAVVHGLDISACALQDAASLDEKFCVNIDEEPIPQKDGYYDFILCSEVLEHCFNEERIITEVFRVLKKGGTAVFSVPNFAFWRHRFSLFCGKLPQTAVNRLHIRFFTAPLLRDLLQKAGFRVVRLHGARRHHRFLCGICSSLFSEQLIYEVTKPDENTL